MIKNYKANSKIGKFFKGKGFYVALGLSFLMIGAASFFAYNQTADKLSSQLSSISGSTTSKPKTDSSSDYEDVVGNQNSIPKNTPTTTPKVVEDAVKVVPPVTSEAAPQQTEPQAEDVAAAPVAMPIEGEVFNPFSDSELVKSNTTGVWQTHNGVDIAGNLGDEIKAMTSGTVLEVNEDSLWGVCITIDHGNGITARYCNLNKGVTVQAGSEVDAGTVIGAIGDTAEIESADAPHLHFEVLRNGQYIEPIEFIGIGTN